MDRGAQWATVYGVTKSQVPLNDQTAAAIQHRELYSILCNDISRKSLNKSGYTLTDSFAVPQKQRQCCKSAVLCLDALCVQLSVTLWTIARQLLCPWDSPGKSTRVGCHPLLQRILPTQESNPGLLHCKQILNQLSHQRSPRILEWAAYPFSRETSQPRNQTGVSCIAGRFFIS